LVGGKRLVAAILPPTAMNNGAGVPVGQRSSVFSRIRRSFRRKRESYCINCGHVTKSCYHNKAPTIFQAKNQAPLLIGYKSFYQIKNCAFPFSILILQCATMKMQKNI
jgi:hypothetical protein